MLYSGNLNKVLASLFLVACSCTIIEDSDITDPAELEKIKLTSISLEQDTNKGKKTTSINLLYDSAVNVTDPTTGSVVVRKLMYSFPNPGNLKLKLRSGSTAALQLYCSYLTESRPYTVVLYEKDSAIEIYRFRYNSAGKLNKIISTINPIDNNPFIRHTRDSLVYNGANVSSMIRNSPDGSLNATITIGYGGGGTFLSLSNFEYKGFQYQQMQGNCSNDVDFNTCTGYNIRPIQGSGNLSSNYTVKAAGQVNTLNELQLIDMKAQNGINSSRDYDTYYFHPLMILRNQIPVGKYLFILYAIDWLEPGAPLTQTNFTRDDFVTFKFIYGF